MPGRVELPDIRTIWPGVTYKIAQWKEAIERALSWSFGEGFHVHSGPGGTTVQYTPEAQVKYARTTTGGITARSGATLGQGTVVLETRLGATVSDGAEELCYSTFNTAVTHPHKVMVAWDGSAYALISADCP